MATMDELAMLRRMTDLSSDDPTYTDSVLAGIIDASASMAAAAAQVWTEKAAAYADAVDMSESGSSRSLSQLQAQALKLQEFFDKQASDAATAASGRSYTVGVERV